MGSAIACRLHLHLQMSNVKMPDVVVQYMLEHVLMYALIGFEYRILRGGRFDKEVYNPGEASRYIPACVYEVAARGAGQRAASTWFSIGDIHLVLHV